MDSPNADSSYDVIIIGAGLSGVCSLYHLKERFPSWNIRLLEAGDSPGGVWHWNSYPGARFDSESLSYGFSFDKELLQEWHWKEAFSPQAETQKYIARVCERNGLYANMQFGTTIASAHWQDSNHTWTLTDVTGVQYHSRFLVSCIGFLSAPTLPAIPGIDTFKDQAFHTSRWPRSFDLRRDFGGKRVGIIGTGATGIQTITAIAKEDCVKSLHVFQRTANWSAPLRNTTIDEALMEKHKAGYDDVFRRCHETPMGFIHMADPRNSLDVTETERMEHWEKIYAQPGMSKWLGNFKDTYNNQQANDLYSAFIADKIRSRVNDPVTAEKLIPKNHGFGTRRVPLESGYFESYNKPNVHLVDLQETPIKCVTDTSIVTSDGQYHELDVLIFATGFDAITGAFNAIHWAVKDGRPLLGTSDDAVKEADAVWLDHKARTFLGLTAPSVPNMFMIMGPHQPFGNATRSIEHAVRVITDLLTFCKDKDHTYVEPTEEATREWTQHVFDCAQGSLSNDVDSWMTGVNRNVKGKTERTVARYAGSALEYRRRCALSKDNGWEGLMFA